MNEPIPRIALDLAAPTSRASFRRIAKSFGATNREADALRSALLAAWVGEGGSYELERRLRSLTSEEGDGTHEVEALLTVWFSYAEREGNAIVADDDDVLAGLPDAVRARLAATERR